MWERSFVAVTVLLGGTIDEAIGALPAPSQAAPDICQLAAKLRTSSRSTRATTLAEVARDIAVAIDQVRLV